MESIYFVEGYVEIKEGIIYIIFQYYLLLYNIKYLDGFYNVKFEENYCNQSLLVPEQYIYKYDKY